MCSHKGSALITYYFFFKEFLLKFKATAARFFTLTSNLHKVTPFFDVTVVKKPTSLEDVET